MAEPVTAAPWAVEVRGWGVGGLEGKWGYENRPWRLS